MMINELMAVTHMTRAELSRASGVADSTLRDILDGKTKLERCAAGTLYAIASALGITVEEILEDAYQEDDSENDFSEDDFLVDAFFEDDFSDDGAPVESASYRLCKDVWRVGCRGNTLSYYVFRKNMIELLDSTPDTVFIAAVISGNMIPTLFKKGDDMSGCYLLGLLDYLCEKNHLPLCPMYARYRERCLPRRLFPPELLQEVACLSEKELEKAIEYAELDCIPSFRRHGIIEMEVYLQRDS